MGIPKCTFTEDRLQLREQISWILSTFVNLSVRPRIRTVDKCESRLASNRDETFGKVKPRTCHVQNSWDLNSIFSIVQKYMRISAMYRE